MKKQVVVIAGPTASGKSGFALDIAEALNGEIVNADAFQVYQGLQILTARPDDKEMRGIPHHLYGYVNNFEQEDVIGWVQKASKIITDIEHPIVVGGSGFYLSVLMNGMSPIPDISPTIRERVRLMGADEVRSLLKKGIIPRDIQRQKRALEVLLETGYPIDYFQNLPPKKYLDADFKVFVLLPPRQKLYQRIESRLQQMLEAGCVEEVENLLKCKATGGVMNAIGVKELIDFIEKKCDLNAALKRILLSTRHYAKRQMTWFRHQMPERTKIIQSADTKEVITK